MTPSEFFNAHRKLAIRVGRGFSKRFRFMGWTREDAEQQAQMILWKLAGKARLGDVPDPERLVRVVIRRNMRTELRPGRNLFYAGRMVDALSTSDFNEMIDAPPEVAALLRGEHLPKRRKARVLEWLR